MQETKLTDTAFPSAAFASLGYDSIHHGEGRWNGVAILSCVGIEKAVAGFGANVEQDTDARLLWATCGGVRVASCYVPNGRALDNDHYLYKLWWLDRMRDALTIQADADDKVVLCGDFNVAPTDKDVYDPACFVGTTHTSAQERSKLEALQEWGLVDLFRLHHLGSGLYSWWDYRGGAFYKGKGMRIDLLLGSASMAEASHYALIDRNERKGVSSDKPSDHAPVFVDFAL